MLAQPIDGVELAAGVDRFVDAVGIERERCRPADFDLALLVAQRIGDAQRQAGDRLARLFDLAAGAGGAAAPCARR